MRGGEPPGRSPLLKTTVRRVRDPDVVEAQNLSSWSMVYIVILVMLSFGLFGVGIFSWTQRMAPFTDVPVNLAHSSEMQSVNEEIDAILWYLHIAPTTLGFILSVLWFPFLIRTHFYGLSIKVGLIKTGTVFFSSLLLSGSYAYLALDVSRASDARLGLVNPLVQSYVAFTEHGFRNNSEHHDNQKAKLILWKLHNKLGCCGLTGINEFYEDHITDSFNQSRGNPNWRTTGGCPGNVSMASDATVLPERCRMVPEFCCKRKLPNCNLYTMQQHRTKTPPKTIWTSSCSHRIVGRVCTFLWVIIFTAIPIMAVAGAFIVHLLYWNSCKHHMPDLTRYVF